MVKLVEILEDFGDSTDATDRDQIFEYKQSIQSILERFDEMCDHTWNQLMNIEITLYSQLEEVIENFQIVIKEMLESFLDKSRNTFIALRQLATDYSANICEAFALIEESARDSSFARSLSSVLSSDIEKLLLDRDALQQCLNGSHDYHYTQIDGREDRLNARANQWLKNLVDNLLQDETRRDRAQVLEINKFLDNSRFEFRDLYDNLGIKVSSTKLLSGEDKSDESEDKITDTQSDI